MQKYGEMWAWCWCFFGYWFLFWVFRVLDLNSRQVAVNLKQWFVVLIAFRKFFAAQCSFLFSVPSHPPLPTHTSSLQKSAGLRTQAYQVKAVICVCVCVGYTLVCTELGSLSGVFYHCPSYFLRDGLTESLTHGLNLAGWLASEPALTSHQCWSCRCVHHTWLFTWMLGV